MTPLGALRRGGPGALKALTIERLPVSGLAEADFWPESTDFPVYSAPLPSYHETIGSSFDAYVAEAYKSNGIVFACIGARAKPFSEARFLYQEMDDGRPGALKWGQGLELLETPWPNAQTGELLFRMEQDASLAGNSYWTPIGDQLRRMRPDWTTIVSGVRGDDRASPFELEAEVLGYIYHPRRAVKDRRAPAPVFLTPNRVVHYSPIPDPAAQWRGMSWLTPVLREIDGDTAAMKHKLKFFQNGTVSNLAVSYPENMSVDLFNRYVALFKEHHEGADQAYKTIHLGHGADPKMLGADMKQLDFKVVQGHGETRIAAAAGVGAIIARFSEGMQGSSLNQGNYAAAKRQFADMELRPMWRSAAGALQKLTKPTGRDRLWYDARDIEFLKEDAKASAEIFNMRAAAIRTLTDGGYVPESVVAAVNAENPALLVHSGLLPVQVQEPGTTADTPTPS